MLSYLSKEQNEAIQKSIARSVALKNSKEAREKARREAAVLREERAKERARGRAEKLKEKQEKEEEKARPRVEKKVTIVRKRNDDIRIVEKVQYVAKSGSVYYVIPRKIMNLTGWKLYTRFACTPDPEKHVLVLEESSEPAANQITLCSSGCITANNNICHEVGWNAGDTILVKHEDKKIIMRRVI